MWVEPTQEMRETRRLIDAGVAAGITRAALASEHRRWVRMMKRARQSDYFPKACARQMSFGYSLNAVLDEFEDSGLY